MRNFLLLFPLCLVLLQGQAQTFSATVNQPIPDDGTIVMFTIPVSGLPDVIDTTFGIQTVCVNFTHTYNEDLTVKLMSPDGNVVILFAGVGGGEDNFTNTCLEGTGPTLASGTAPYTGTFQCKGILGDLNKGQNPNGDWTLVVHDTYAFADEGFLIDWNLTFSDQPALPFRYTSSDLPIVKFTTLGAPIDDDPKVPVLMQIIDNGPGQRNFVAQTNYVYEGKIMTEWQGFTGPYYPKKNYDFETIDDAGGEMDTTILGMPREHDWLFKAEYLDHTLLKNSLTYEIARRMGGYAPRTRPCELVLDGTYIGLYFLTEQVKRDKNRVDIAKLGPDDLEGSALTGGYIIEMNINNIPGDWASPNLPINYATCQANVEFKHVYPNSEKIQPEQSAYIRNYVNDFENALLAADFADPATGYRKYANVDAFIDFLIVNEFSVNYDSYGRSTYLYKEKDTDGGKLHCGPPWDYDRAFDYNVPETTNGWVWEITHPYWPFPFWWSRMWQDDAYRKTLACRWQMLRQNTLSKTAFTEYIDSLTTQIHESQVRNFTVWNDLGNRTYADNIDSLKSYLSRRIDWIDAALSAEQVAAPTFYLPSDTVLCEGGIFDAGAFIGQQYTYNWQPGPDTATIVFPQNGQYNLLVTDAYGCYAKQAMEVTLVPSINGDFSSQQLGGNGAAWAFVPVTQNAQQYHWEFGDGQTSAEMSPTYHYASSGTFLVTLTITAANGCVVSTTQSIQFVSTAATAPNLLEGNVTPNPFTDYIRVVLPFVPKKGFTITLANELGQVIYRHHTEPNTQTLQIPTTDCTPGMYLLRVLLEDKVLEMKMVRI